MKKLYASAALLLAAIIWGFAFVEWITLAPLPSSPAVTSWVR